MTVKKYKSNELAIVFLAAFVLQLMMVTFVSYSLTIKLSKVDTEWAFDGEMSDELDADEGDFSTLMEEEIEKELYLSNPLQIPSCMQKRTFFNYVQRKSDYKQLINHVPPEKIS